MGYYINYDSQGHPLPAKGKVQALLNDGAKIISRPTTVGTDSKVVCVVENLMFDAAGYCYDDRELADWLADDSGRRMTFLEYEKAKELSGYEQVKAANS
jgi:hypothetical protein